MIQIISQFSTQSIKMIEVFNLTLKLPQIYSNSEDCDKRTISERQKEKCAHRHIHGAKKNIEKIMEKCGTKRKVFTAQKIWACQFVVKSKEVGSGNKERKQSID